MISQEKTLAVENKKRIILWRTETPTLISTMILYHDKHHVIAIQQTTTGCDNHEELKLISTHDEVTNVGVTVTDTEDNHEELQLISTLDKVTKRQILLLLILQKNLVFLTLLHQQRSLEVEVVLPLKVFIKIRR